MYVYMYNQFRLEQILQGVSFLPFNKHHLTANAKKDQNNIAQYIADKKAKSFVSRLPLKRGTYARSFPEAMIFLRSRLETCK